MWKRRGLLLENDRAGSVCMRGVRGQGRTGAGHAHMVRGRALVGEGAGGGVCMALCVRVCAEHVRDAP
jgi:hypothetical protein